MDENFCKTCLKDTFSEEELKLLEAGKIEFEYSGMGICPICLRRRKLVECYTYTKQEKGNND